MNRRAFALVLATLAAALLVLRAVEYAPAVPVRSPLQEFPLQVPGWRGQSSFLTPDVVAALHADDYLVRTYQDRTGGSLGLFVAYYSSQPPGNRIHSPAVCLPAAGWYIARAGLEQIRMADRTITVNQNLIQKGEDRELVLYWYQMHGLVAAKELQAISLLAWTSLTQRRSDEALVRINAPLIGNTQDTMTRETTFVRDVFPRLKRFLPE